MFTGIVQDCVQVVRVERSPEFATITLRLGEELVVGLERGASVSVGGVCLTTTNLDGPQVSFDAMGETLRRTTVGSMEEGQRVNVERSARAGQEIGGHMLSGHVDTMAEIVEVAGSEHNHVVTFRCEPHFLRYVFAKGFIALDGVSLTVVDVHPEQGTFTVHFIPETLERTTFGQKKAGGRVNLEVERQTQVLVDTIERTLERIHARSATSGKNEPPMGKER